MRKTKWYLDTRYWMGMFVIGTMVLSTIAFVAMDDGDTGYNYNGHKFAYQNNLWMTKINKEYVTFEVHPADIEYLKINSEFLNKTIGAKQISVTFDSNNTEIQYVDYIRFDMSTRLTDFDTYLVSGVTSQSEAYSNFQLINCSEASDINQVIYFKQSSENKIEYNDNCMTVSGNGRYFLDFKNKLMYHLYGVV